VSRIIWTPPSYSPEAPRIIWTPPSYSPEVPRIISTPPSYSPEVPRIISTPPSYSPEVPRVPKFNLLVGDRTPSVSTPEVPPSPFIEGKCVFQW